MKSYAFCQMSNSVCTSGIICRLYKPPMCCTFMKCNAMFTIHMRVLYQASRFKALHCTTFYRTTKPHGAPFPGLLRLSLHVWALALDGQIMIGDMCTQEFWPCQPPMDHDGDQSPSSKAKTFPIFRHSIYDSGKGRKVSLKE